MARSFSTFANGGNRTDGELLGNVPRAVLRVKGGNRVYENVPVAKPALNANDNAILTSMLQRVVEAGTGQRADLDDRPAAGKTGTTENHGDAWFVGYTPQLAVAVWVGYPNKLKPMLTEFDGDPVAGGTYPALIWKSFVERALDEMEEPPESFPVPQHEPAIPVRVVYRGDKWLVDNGNCRDAREVLYVVGQEPTEPAPCKPNEVDVPRVVGTKLEDAEDRLASMPLTAEVILRPALPGERLGRVVEQYPKGGTLPSWDSVRIVVPKATEGVVPDVTGFRVRKARERLAARRLIAVIGAATPGEAGVVVSQSPAGGVAGERGMKISLVVGRG